MRTIAKKGSEHNKNGSTGVKKRRTTVAENNNVRATVSWRRTTISQQPPRPRRRRRRFVFLQRILEKRDSRDYCSECIYLARPVRTYRDRANTPFTTHVVVVYRDFYFTSTRTVPGTVRLPAAGRKQIIYNSFFGPTKSLRAIFPNQLLEVRETL